jgi:hypothetical protein
MPHKNVNTKSLKRTAHYTQDPAQFLSDFLSRVTLNTPGYLSPTHRRQTANNSEDVFSDNTEGNP